MNLVGVVLVVISLWCVYCGVNSFIPVPLALAILQDPSHAQSLITEAQSEVASTKGTFGGSLAGSNGAGSVGAGGGGGSSGGFDAAPITDPTALQSYAFNQLTTKYGITDAANQSALVKLWNQESGWNPNAVNPSSGAWGIAQTLPEAHPDITPNTNGQAQIDWGLDYIINRYGTPLAAWAHEVANDWY